MSQLLAAAMLESLVSYQDITYAVDDRVAVITLNRPDRMNAFGQQLRKDFPDAVARADHDPEVRVILVTGAGGRAFSTGYDQKESAQSDKKKSVEEWRGRMDSAYQFTRCVMDCSKPTIAVIEGYCLAGAMELAQMCDIRYCSDDARFGAIEARFSHGLATMIMPWIVGNHCRELIYTGDMFDAQEALRIGLVTRVYPKADLTRETLKIAKRMSRVALSCLQWNKRALRETFEIMGQRAALRYGVEAAAIMDAQSSPEYDRFDEIRRTEGLSKANQWRDAQFKQFE
jgi:enoyl-CoA hydratase/carnithine racemase